MGRFFGEWPQGVHHGRVAGDEGCEPLAQAKEAQEGGFVGWGECITDWVQAGRIQCDAVVTDEAAKEAKLAWADLTLGEVKSNVSLATYGEEGLHDVQEFTERLGRQATIVEERPNVLFKRAKEVAKHSLEVWGSIGGSKRHPGWFIQPVRGDERKACGGRWVHGYLIVP